MTDEVGDLVLRDNYLQTQALSIAMTQSSQLLDVHARLIRQMELDGELDRQIEFLPDKEEIDERLSMGKGLTAPELSVLLAYVKINFFQQLLVTKLPDDVFYGGLLTQYFPEPLRRRFSELMPNHRLCREIISTVVANEMVNRVGITFAYRLQEETGANAESIARAFTVAREIFTMPAVWQKIEDLDNVVPASTQIFMLLEGRKLVERASRWLLRNRPQPIDIANNVDFFAPGIKKLCAKLPSLLADSTLGAIQDKVTELTSQQVPEKLAQSMSMFGQLLSTLDIVEVANGLDLSVEQVASVYYALGEKLEFSWLHVQIVNLPRSNRWQALSRAALRDDLYSQHRQLTRDVLLLTDSQQEDAGQRVEQWMSLNTAPILRSRQILADLKTAGEADFAMLPVAMREIRGMSSINASQATAAVGIEKTAKKALRPKSGSNKKSRAK